MMVNNLTLITYANSQLINYTLLNIKCDMIIFTNKNNYEEIWAYRKQLNLLSKSCILIANNSEYIIDFLECAIKSNYFQSEYFCWIDYNTKEQDEFFPHNFINKLMFYCDDKIHFICFYKNNIYRFLNCLFLMNYSNLIIFIDIMKKLMKKSSFLDSHNNFYLNHKNLFTIHESKDEKTHYYNF